jgi:hypothetical protein
MASDQEPTASMWRRGRSSARNVLFLGGGRGPTPEEVDEREDVYRR